MGWVSIFDPDALARLLAMPEGARPLAVLCLGYVDEFYDQPLLEQQGWDSRRDLADLVGENGWPDGPPVDPSAAALPDVVADPASIPSPDGR